MPQTTAGLSVETGTKENEDGFRMGGILVVSICHFVHDVYTSFLSPLLPLLIEKFSMSLTQAGFLGTVMQLPALINPLIGRWADRGRNTRYFIIFAPAMTAVPMSLLGVAPSYGVIVLLLVVTGISTSIFHVPAPVLVSQLAGRKKGKGMSFFMVGGELARTLGPVAAVGLVSLMGLSGYWPVMGVGVFASVWVWIRFKDMQFTMEGRKPVPFRKTWKEMAPVLKPLSGILFARGFMHGSMATFLPIFIRQETGSLWLAGAGLALYEAAGVAGIFSAGPLSDRIGRRKVLRICLVCAPLGVLSFMVAPGWLKAPALMFTGFTLLSTTPVMLAMVQEHAVGSPSSANGFFMMISFLARSSVIVLIGLMGDLLGLKLTYFITALLGLGGIPFLLMLPEKKTAG